MILSFTVISVIKLLHFGTLSCVELCEFWVSKSFLASQSVSASIAIVGTASRHRSRSRPRCVASINPGTDSNVGIHLDVT